MYWPDNRLRRKRTRSLLGPTLLTGLLFGLLLGGSLNDWWRLSFAADEVPAEPVLEENMIRSAVAGSTPTPTADRQAAVSVVTAPGLTLSDLFDETKTLSLSDYIGRPVILNFWASWCVPCRTEMPALQHAYEENRDEGLVVLGVNQTFVDNVDAARDFVDELALTFPNVRDDDGTTSEKLYQVMGLPTSVFITAEGELAHTQIGQMTDEQIETFSKRLLAGETISP